MFCHGVPNLLPHHGRVFHHQGFFDRKEADLLFQQLLIGIKWKHEHVKLFGKHILQPRLTASFADRGVVYGYSGMILESERWNEGLLIIKAKVEQVSGLKFNTALLNLYRNGDDYMGWHRDNESALGPEPPVASVSFGAKRKFQLRTHKEKSNLLTIELLHGDLLLMLDETQRNWEHRLPKDPKTAGPRINITFRNVLRK